MTAQCYYNWDKAPSAYEFSPGNLITAGDGGFWLDVGDWEYMFTDTAMTTKVTASGQLVAAVKDRGPNGFNVIQTDPDARPSAIIQGGYKGLNFASGQFLETPGNKGMALATMRGYIIMETDVTDTFQRIISTSSSGTDTATADAVAIHTGDLTGHFGIRARTGAVNAQVGSTGNSPLGLYEYELTGASLTCWYEGTAGPKDASAGGMDTFGGGKVIIGCQSSGNAGQPTVGAFDGRVFNIVHLGALPSSNNNTKLRNWLNVNRI